MNVDATVVVALITVGGVLFTAFTTLAGVRFTQRQARAAADRAAELDRQKVNAEAYDKARATWDQHVESLRTQVGELREESERLRTAARELRGRVDELESGRSLDRRRIRELTDYARTLLRILGEHEIAYPPPPGEL